MIKMKKWKLWLIFGITLLIAIGLICLNLYVSAKTVIIVFIVIDFLVMTFVLQAAISATFKYKPKPKKYPSKAFNNYDPDKLLDNLIKKGFKETRTKYGNIYLHIENKTAYKIIVITNVEAYLTPDEHKNTSAKANNALKECTHFVGHEIFLDYNDKALASLPDFSFEGKNIFYEAFYLDKETYTLIEPNAITATNDFVPLVKKMREEYLLLTEE